MGRRTGKINKSSGNSKEEQRSSSGAILFCAALVILVGVFLYVDNSLPPKPSILDVDKKIRDRFEYRMDKLLNSSNEGDMDFYINDKSSLGPLISQCARVGGGERKEFYSKTYGKFPAANDHAGIGIRSLSKVFAAVAFLALVESGKYGSLSPESTLGEYFEICDDTLLADTPASDMMCMLPKLDNRLNVGHGLKDKTVDHVQFPPYCDTAGLDPIECLERIICPSYKNESLSSLVDELSVKDVTVVDEVCKDRHSSCDLWKTRGFCTENPRYMWDFCPTSCGFCDKDGPTYESYRPLYDIKDDYIVKKRNAKCNYDNYSYTLLDAIVMKTTGKQLWQWVLLLIAEPLGLDDMIRCMSPPFDKPKKDCYQVPKFDYATDSDKWPLWKGGPESQNWPGVTLFASSSDLVKFLTMIHNRGTYEGTKILSPESIDKMLVPYNKEGFECQGMEGFGWGLGNCGANASLVKSNLCEADGWYGWGGSYGARLFLTMDDPVGVACVTLPNIPSDIVKNDAGEPQRIASRQHVYAHLQSKLVRTMWPFPFSPNKKAKYVKNSRATRTHPKYDDDF